MVYDSQKGRYLPFGWGTCGDDRDDRLQAPGRVQEMAPVVDSIEDAMEYFGGDLEELLNGHKGWDLSEGLWQKSGWREFKRLRKKLEKLRELRDLVCLPCTLPRC